MWVKSTKIYFRSFKSLLKDLLLPIITAGFILSNGYESKAFVPAEILLPLSLLGHVRSILVDVVSDKSDRYKEYLKINGLTSKAYNVSMLLFCYMKVALFTVVSCFGFFIINEPNVIFSPASLTALYFCTGIATTHLALFLTNFFDNKELSGDLGGFVYTILSFVYLAAFETKSSVWYFISLLFPQNALTYAVISNQQ